MGQAMASAEKGVNAPRLQQNGAAIFASYAGNTSIMPATNLIMQARLEGILPMCRHDQPSCL